MKDKLIIIGLLPFIMLAVIFQMLLTMTGCLRAPTSNEVYNNMLCHGDDCGKQP